MSSKRKIGPEQSSGEQKRPSWMLGDEEDLYKGERRPEKNKKQLEREADEARREEVRRAREIVPVTKESKYEFGDRGSSWRMMKLQRVFEIAEEEKRSVESVALDRYGVNLPINKNMEDFQEALHERNYLESKKETKDDKPSDYKYNLVKSKFKAPKTETQTRRVVDQNEPKVEFATKKTVYKVVDVKPVLTTNELNELYSKVLKAKILRSKDLDDLEDEYEFEKSRAGSAQIREKRGSSNVPETKERRIPISQQQTHDKHGNRIANINETPETLQDLVRQEKTNKSTDIYDKELANQISRDSGFKEDLDYLDESSDRLTKRDAENRFRQERKAARDQRSYDTKLSECIYCRHPNRPPQISTVAIGVKTYLALPQTIEMVPYHCLIVPFEHCTSTLELEDDAWDEIRNFQKCLIHMCESKNLSIIFMEQVIKIKDQKHSYIECIPIPSKVYPYVPQYYKEALMSAEGDWTQHKSVIVTDRGFRRSMVKDLPYFHVWFDPNRGMGHVIEEPKEWPPWFGQEVIASVLDLPPEKWRRPKDIEMSKVAARIRTFVEAWRPFDWTKMLDE